MMLDLLLVTLPPVGVMGPLLGPAMVFASARRAGFQVQQTDFNLKFSQNFQTEPAAVEWLNFDTYNANESGEIINYLHQAIPMWIEEIRTHHPRWVGFSIFSVRGQFVLETFLPELKRSLPDLQVVVGGSGIIEDSFYRELLTKGYINAFVRGEGEEAIISLLRGNLNAPGINGNPFSEIKDLNQLAPADYTGLPLSEYGQIELRALDVANRRRPVFYIEGSRGCVRKCHFCDVPYMKPGFRYRSANSILTEIEELFEKYVDVQHIYFVDSLVNGSLKHLKELCLGLIELQKHRTIKYGWSGYFIIRSKSSYPPDNFDLLAKSGARLIRLGIESGSFKVRKDMNKHILDEDVDYHLKECERVNIGVAALLMLGYPTETREDFLKTLDLLQRHRSILGRQNSFLSCSWKVGITGHKSELGFHPEKFGIQYDIHGEWYSKDVNVLIASKRYLEFCQLADELQLEMMQKYSKRRVIASIERYGIAEEDLKLSEEQLQKIYHDFLNQRS